MPRLRFVELLAELLSRITVGKGEKIPERRYTRERNWVAHRTQYRAQFFQGEAGELTVVLNPIINACGAVFVVGMVPNLLVEIVLKENTQP